MRLNKIILSILLLSHLNVYAQTPSVANPLSEELRESYIQQALQLRKQEDYTAAIAQLDLILASKTNDAPVLLLKGDLQLQCGQFESAANTYNQLLPLNYENTITQINLSYSLFMIHKAAQALVHAQNAWQNDTANTSAVVNYFNAMLWNKQTSLAASFLEKQSDRLREDQLLVLKARLFSTRGKYQQGLDYYSRLVKASPNKYYVQEYAEVLLSKNAICTAREILKANQSIFSINEYKTLQQKIKASNLQNSGTAFVYFKDVAQNIRIENSAWWHQSKGHTYSLGVRAGAYSVTSAQQQKSRTQFVGLSVVERWSMAWSGQTDITVQKIALPEQRNFNTLTGKQSIQYQPSDRRSFGIFYSTDVLNYTSSLIEKNIRSNDIGYTAHIMFNGKNGLYSQGVWGALSDHNQRYQWFGSLYHVFNTSPLLKSGINFSTLHFKDNSVTAYFSPGKYLSTELFADYNTSIPGFNGLTLSTQLAAGMQKIEATGWDPAFRLQAELGYNYHQFETSLKYQSSNVASGTGTGYKFNWFTFRLLWKW